MEAKETEINDPETAGEEEIDLAPVHEILGMFPTQNRRYLIPILQKSKLC